MKLKSMHLPNHEENVSAAKRKYFGQCNVSDWKDIKTSNKKPET